MFGDDLRAGLVTTLMDCWVLDTAVWSQLNTACWVPVDHDPAPVPVTQFFENSGAVPIAMSRFGQERLEHLNPLYVPHGIDTQTYKPYPQDEARKATGMPEDDFFIVGMVAANKGNPSRKCFAEAFQAFKAFHERHPDSKLYIHSEVSGRFQGVDLLSLLDRVGVPNEATIFSDQYRTVHFPFPNDVMARVYSSFDVCLQASAGEGFGIPVIEAQACGVPVVVSDFSAQPELVGAGWCVEGHKHYTAIGSWQFRPDVADITDALCHAYADRGNPEYAKKARAKAEEYDVRRVLTEHMLPALEQAAARYEDRKPVELAA